MSVEPDRHIEGRWIVLAHYSGRTVRLRSFATADAAQAWADELVGGIQ